MILLNCGNPPCVPKYFLATPKIFWDQWSRGPIHFPPLRVPISVKPDLEKELEKLVNLGVLKPVTEPT